MKEKIKVKALNFPQMNKKIIESIINISSSQRTSEESPNEMKKTSAGFIPNSI